MLVFMLGVSIIIFITFMDHIYKLFRFVAKGMTMPDSVIEVSMLSVLLSQTSTVELPLVYAAWYFHSIDYAVSNL